MSYKGIGYLRTKLALKSERNKLRYKYYEMKNHVLDNMSTIPPNFKFLKEC